jgi:hypothetical protein
VRIFTSSRPARGPNQHPIQWVNGALSSGIKRPGREADDSPPTCVEVKKTLAYTSTLSCSSRRRTLLLKYKEHFSCEQLLNPFVVEEEAAK